MNQQQALQQQLPPRTRLRVGAHSNFVWLAGIDRFNELGMLRALLAGLLGAAVLSAIIITVLNIIDNGLGPALNYLVRYLLVACALAVGLALAGFYLLYIPLVGRRTHMLFDLREDGILLVYLNKNTHRADIRFDLAALASGATGTAGLRSRRRDRYVQFGNVKRVTLDPARGVIRLAGYDMTQSRVYASQQDFGFVSAYITRRCSCPAKTRGK